MFQPARTSEPIPGYVVQDRIGVGGYGEVWSAQAPGGLAKAIKFVYGYFDDQRAARELKALERIKQVRHPFLLSLERFEIIDGQLIIVTELAEMSLKDRFEQAKEAQAVGIPRDELLGYLRDAADALDYMSANFSLQHLDVKPENLLLIGGRVKVADFGLVKDLHDVTASLMGGLTPLYAPPEVFDGRPSPHSDQYSLAIVYQEMLTGVLPFPGRTPAQLASQHLHARPRLAPLPPADQGVIARALSKDPSQRFGNCRALVDCLLSADQRDRGPRTAPDRRPTPATSDTTPIRSNQAKADTDCQPPDGRARVAAARPSPVVKTQVIGSEGAGAWTEKTSAQASLAPSAANQAAVDLPPVEVTSDSDGLRPTLFIGIGGTAGRTLRRLRRRLRDRLGPASVIPTLQMLLLDTDAKNLYQATQGDSETALGDSETVSLPLRNAHDYTADSRNILQWLSRRWLYNIPRSLQTEGRRPLGRLALVDHSQKVLDRLRKALAEVTSREAVVASSQATGMAFRSEVPRVFVIASISGGTGSGMVLDVAYAVRKVLADLGLSDDGVCGLLIHSTDRNASSNDLALANAYACLSELQHYSGPGCYPGELACGLPAFAGTFPNAYVVHLGDELSDHDFDAATGMLASYLYLDSVTSAGAVFDACRNATPADGLVRDCQPQLRTFGLTTIGSMQSELPTLATELLCREVVNRWRGAAHIVQREHRSSSRIEIATQPVNAPGGANALHVEQMAADHAKQLGLNVAQLRDQVGVLLENELGGNAPAIFAKLRQATQAKQSAEGSANVSQLLHAIGNLFGISTVEDDAVKPSSAQLQMKLDPKVQKFATSLGDAVRGWILRLIEDPRARVSGACQAKEWYACHLYGLEAQCIDLLKPAQHNLQALMQLLLDRKKAAPARSRGFGVRRAEKSEPEVDDTVLLVIELRLQEAALYGLRRLLRLISSQVSAAGDQIKDLQRELNWLTQEFAAQPPWQQSDGDAADPKTSLDVGSIVAAKLRLAIGELAQKVDQRLQELFIQQTDGLLNVCRKVDAVRSTIPTVLRAEARTAIVSALKGISIAEAVLGTDAAAEGRSERLAECLAAARPRLNLCGGSQRLLAVLPASSAGSVFQNALSHDVNPRATIVSDSDADLVLCYEVQELSLPNVAARLIGDRGEVVKIAERLHTRTDVAWTTMAHCGNFAKPECALT